MSNMTTVANMIVSLTPVSQRVLESGCVCRDIVLQIIVCLFEVTIKEISNRTFSLDVDAGQRT